MKRNRVIVVGAGGLQAKTLIRLLRKQYPSEIELVAVDLHWAEKARAELGTLCTETHSLDVLTEQTKFLSICQDAVLIVNMAGPFFLLGPNVIRTAILLGIDYLDICDDADATLNMLDFDPDARAAGIRALIGMGASPGTTNVLARIGFDAMGRPPGGRVEINWTVPSSEVSETAFVHILHGFRTALSPNGSVPDWDQLEPEYVEFPGDLGRVLLTRLGHPEPVTLPRFLGVTTTNKGGITPSEALPLCWSLARLHDQIPGGANTKILHQILHEYLRLLPPREEWNLSGMRIDVTSSGVGYRFISSTDMPVGLSTSVPAAAGVIMMLEDKIQMRGVIAPECLSPTDFLNAAHAVSPQGGALRVYRLSNGRQGDRVRMSALLECADEFSEISDCRSSFA